MVKIRIGTRKSKLALAQTNMVVQALEEQYPAIKTELVYVTTTGDKQLDKSLTEIGGKGVFVSEIEQALQNGLIDMAVHSAKDLPAVLAEGLEISAVLKRGNYRDVLVTQKGICVVNSPDFIIGTGSMRRRAGLQKQYADIGFADIRGNIDTRLQKLKDGFYDGIILAAAGLERIGMNHSEEFDYRAFDYTEMLPSPCQGIIAVETRKNDIFNEYFSRINDKETFICFETEREMIKKLNVNCTVPLGAYSLIENGKISVFLSADMKEVRNKCGEIAERFELVKELCQIDG